MYTSGTTGFPKGAMVSHRNHIACFYLFGERMRASEKTRELIAAPLFTNFGNTCVIETFIRGGCIVLMESFDPEEALRLISKERVTNMSAIPTMAIMMLDHPKFKDYDLTSWKAVSLGGAPFSTRLVQDLKKNTSLEIICNGYGLVEGSGLTTTSAPDTPLDLIAVTQGKPLPYCEVKIRDPQTGEELPPGKDGEICSRGTTVPDVHITAGYYKMPDKTAELIRNGWLYSGDMGRLREDGYLELTGRVKDMILVGGFNVYPAEIENLLATHPKIKMVSVVGVPERRLGEVPMAYVVLKKGTSASEDEIINFCRDRAANIKVPRYVKFTQEFPMTASGKIQKFKLIEMAIK